MQRGCRPYIALHDPNKRFQFSCSCPCPRKLASCNLLSAVFTHQYLGITQKPCSNKHKPTGTTPKIAVGRSRGACGVLEFRAQCCPLTTSVATATTQPHCEIGPGTSSPLLNEKKGRVSLFTIISFFIVPLLCLRLLMHQNLHLNIMKVSLLLLLPLSVLLFLVLSL